MVHTVKKIITAVVSVVFFLAAAIALQRLVVPKYAADLPEGNFTAEYYDETTEHDVLMIGDCEVYENIDPIYLWQRYGITSYIRGNAQQLIWQSYYMLEDTLKYETPKAVVFNVQALKYSEPQREEYNRMALDGMKWSKTKLDAIRASMCKGEKLIDYIFPILRYHSRILELNKDDIRYYAKRKKVANNGYYMRIDVLPVSESDVADTSWLSAYGETEENDENQNLSFAPEEDIIDPWAEIVTEEDDEPENPLPKVDKGEKFSDFSMEYMDKLRILCEENNIKLILIKAPSLAPVWYDSYERQVDEYSEKYGLRYINFYEHLDEILIDYETDTYDGGLHMNRSGADKVSEYLGKILATEYGIGDHRGEPVYDNVYEEKQKFYNDMIQAQQEEINKYGKVISY